MSYNIAYTADLLGCINSCIGFISIYPRQIFFLSVVYKTTDDVDQKFTLVMPNAGP